MYSNKEGFPNVLTKATGGKFKPVTSDDPLGHFPGD